MCDRTSEFHSVIQSVRQRRGGVQAPLRRTLSQDLAASSQFTKIAKRIAHDIAETYTKLEKLTLLASRQSLYDDSTDVIQELTYLIKQDINALNKSISKLQAGTAQASTSLPQQTKKHSKTVVVSLRSRLATISKKFKNVLQVRSNNLRAAKERQSHFAFGDPVAPSASAMPTLMADDEAVDRSAPVVLDMQDQQLAVIEGENSYLQDRQDAVQQVEKTITELAEMFKQLAHMVQAQGEQVERIDEYVADTEMNVELAHTEVVKFVKSISSNRWLMLKIFGVVLAFFLFFVIFLA